MRKHILIFAPLGSLGFYAQARRVIDQYARNERKPNNGKSYEI